MVRRAVARRRIVASRASLSSIHTNINQYAAPDGVTPGAVFSVTLPEDGPSDGRDTFSSQTVQQAVPVDQSAAAVGGGGGGGVIAVTAIPEPPTATSSKTSGANPF